MTSEFERVKLREQLFHALADLVTFGVQSVDFFLQGLYSRKLLAQLGIERLGAVLSGGAGFAFCFDQLHGSGDAVFESGKVSAAKGQIALLVVHFRVLGVFRDLGFQR
jgi:hypothetical protein